MEKDINNEFSQLQLVGGFDHPYLINKENKINHIATVRSPLTDLTLDVYSTEDVVVFYAGNLLATLRLQAELKATNTLLSSWNSGP